MANEVYDHQILVRAGRQSAFGTPNGFSGPDHKASANATRWWYIPVSKDGFKGRGTRKKEPLDTQHAYRGALWVVERERNQEPLQVTAPLAPHNAKFMLDMIFAIVSGAVEPYTFQWWVNQTGWGGGTGAGKELQDCVGRSIGFQINKGGPQTVVCNLSAFLRSDKEVTGTVPSFELPTIDPYDALHCFIDLVQVGSVFAGNNPLVRSIDFSLDQETTISDFQADPLNDHLDSTWSKFANGTPTIRANVNVVINSKAQLAYLRARVTTDWTLRLFAWHPQSSYFGSTATAMNTGGGASTILTVASTTGLAVGDVITLISQDLTKANVCTVTALTGTTITVADADILQSTTGTLYIRNCGWQVYTPRLELLDVSDPVTDGNHQVATLTLVGRLLAGQTDIVQLKAYNDDQT